MTTAATHKKVRYLMIASSAIREDGVAITIPDRYSDTVEGARWHMNDILNNPDYRLASATVCVYASADGKRTLVDRRNMENSPGRLTPEQVRKVLESVIDGNPSVTLAQSMAREFFAAEPAAMSIEYVVSVCYGKTLRVTIDRQGNVREVEGNVR